jgi:hypothetical protein
MPLGTIASEIDPSACVSPQVIDVRIPGLSLQSAVTFLKSSAFTTKSLYSAFLVVMNSSAAAQ